MKENDRELARRGRKLGWPLSRIETPDLNLAPGPPESQRGLGSGGDCRRELMS